MKHGRLSWHSLGATEKHQIRHRYVAISPSPLVNCNSQRSDRGGTFTDVWASVPGQKDIVLKLLSVDPDNYDDAPSEGIRRVLEIVSGQEISRQSPIPKDLIHSIRMGTTVATNGTVPVPQIP